MSIVPTETDLFLGQESAGTLMTAEDFDAVTEFDENYQYELVHGVLVVNPIPLPAETHPNDLLGQWLWNYHESHPEGKILDCTLPQQYVRTRSSRRLADRLIWTGMGRVPDLRRDVASIAVEFVSTGRRSRQRDYVDKPHEYQEAGISEYWIIDRFQRALTVIRNRPEGQEKLVISEDQIYESPLLPGFELPLARLLAAADLWASQVG
jgi:Uma2 family endonuclease